MANKRKGKRDKQDNVKDYTPRKSRLDGGSARQTHLRPDIAEAMRPEMLSCYAEDFLNELAPFTPSSRWVKDALAHLKDKGLLLEIPADPSSTTTVSGGRKTKKAARRRASAVPDSGALKAKVDAKDTPSLQWKSYGTTPPREMRANEKQVFKPLEDIVQALLECPSPDGDRKHNGCSYRDCPDQPIESQIEGCNFKVDAVLVDPEPGEKLEIGTAAAGTASARKAKKRVAGKKKVDRKASKTGLKAVEIAVPMEFKKDVGENIYNNRDQLVSAVNHIMNDDPSRKWVYGITIENTEMSLWYFSRSYSMKSDTFNFTKDFDKFIRTFLSFLYATHEELGYDTSIEQIYANDTWHTVYKMKTEGGLKYYKTLQPLFNPRTLCITGRKSRVWRVIEVVDTKNLEPKPNAPEVVLKDCWVDRDDLTEMEKQQKIFEQLAEVKEDDYDWAPDGLKTRLRDGLAHPEKYFMKILSGWDLGLNKAKPDFRPDPDLLPPLFERSRVGKKHASRNTQRLPTPLNTSHTSAPRLAASSLPDYKGRRFNIKRHYRVIYAEVGQSLAHTTSLSDAVRAFEDIFVAITLLYLARWVHRDISEGNIILVRGKGGIRAKLSDLEYARSFESRDGVVSTDPKTGTPYFMPVEIDKGSFLYPKISKMRPSLARVSTENKVASVLTYSFAHDLESLWWIMVWIIVVRIKNGWNDFQSVFTTINLPFEPRQDFFLHANEDYLETLTDQALCDCDAPKLLDSYNRCLCEFYEKGERQNIDSYQFFYEEIWKEMEPIIPEMSNVIMELENPHDRTPPSLKRRKGDTKRARSVSDSDSHTAAEEGSSKKKLKASRDVFEDADRSGDD